MKRVLLVVLLGLVAVSSPLWASGSGEDELSGTWFGGSTNPDHEGFKYKYVFVPTGPDRWCLIANGAYSPDSIGAQVATPWSGEVFASDDGYEMRLIALTTNDPVHPPEELPTIQAVRGYLSIDEAGVGHITYDLYALYGWDQIPFVDEPSAWVLEPGTGELRETIHRISTKNEFY